MPPTARSAPRGGRPGLLVLTAGPGGRPYASPIAGGRFIRARDRPSDGLTPDLASGAVARSECPQTNALRTWRSADARPGSGELRDRRHQRSRDLRSCRRVHADQRGHRDSLCPIGVVVSSQDRCEIIALQRREQSPGPAAAVPLSGAKQKPTAVGPAQLFVLKRDNLGPRYRIGDAGVASNVVGAPGAAQAATRADARQGPGRQSCLSSARRSGRSAWSNELRLSVCALLRRLLECR